MKKIIRAASTMKARTGQFKKRLCSLLTINQRGDMAEKKKSHFQTAINMIKMAKFKAIAAVKGLTRDEALEDAIQDWNEKHKGVLG